MIYKFDRLNSIFFLKKKKQTNIKVKYFENSFYYFWIKLYWMISSNLIKFNCIKVKLFK